MGKRGNENAQQSKEDWESSQNDEGATAPVGGFTVASGDQLRRRRIIKVGRKWKTPDGGAGGVGPPAAVAAPAASAAPRPPRAGPAGSSNPFANVSLMAGGASAPAPAAAQASAPKAPNPFANVSFAASSGAPAAPAPAPVAAAPSSSIGNGFGGGVLFGAKPKPAPAAAPSAPAASPPPAGPSSKHRKDDELNWRFLNMVRSESRNNPMSDWSVWMKEYMQFAGRVAREIDGSSSAGGGGGAASGSNGGGGGAAPMGGITLTSPAPTPAPAPAPASDQAQQQQPFAGFSFAAPAAAASGSGSGSGSGSAAASKPFTSFSFGPAKAAPVPAPAAPGGDDDDEATPKEDPAQVQKETNLEDDTLLEIRAKYFKLVGKDWKAFCTGPLRLYRNKVDPTKKKMVMRDAVGKVQLNLAVTKGMVFNKQVKKDRGNLRFFAVQDQKKGPEQFNIVVKAQNLDKLYDTLRMMAS